MTLRKPAPSPRVAPAFTPVATRARHDGWTADRQRAFVEALAESACVADATRAVDMSAGSAYALRRRPDAQAFRAAWDAALDYAVHRLSEAAFARALNGTATPVFFQGEQVGERRRYDEQLTRFLLSRRDIRYAHIRTGTKMRQPLPDPARDLIRVLAALVAHGSKDDESNSDVS